MVESHITVPRRFISANHDDDVTVRWGNWAEWAKLDETPEEYARQGKRQFALSYYGKDDPKEDCFFSFATAKLSNLVWDVGGEPGMRFCKFRLGMPREDSMATDGEIYYRTFERGFVAVNPSEEESASANIDSGDVADLFSGDTLVARNGRVSVKLGPGTGRVYLSRR
jgi:hypothetical protein